MKKLLTILAVIGLATAATAGTNRVLTTDVLSGGDNFIKGGGFESAKDIGRWELYDDVAVAEPVNCTGGGVPGITFVQNTSSYNKARISKDTADHLGEGVSYTFNTPINVGTQEYSVTFKKNGTETVGDASDLRVYFYNATTAELIKPKTETISIIEGIYKTTAFLKDNGTHRLCFHVATTSTAAWYIDIDDIEVKIASSRMGLAGTNWTAYTPATEGLGTIAAVDFFWRRIGGDLEVRGQLTTGTTTATPGKIGLPNGLTIDSSRINNQGHAGKVIVNGDYAFQVSWFVIAVPGTATDGVFISRRYAPASDTPLTLQNASSIVVIAAWHSFKFSVPIQGWDASVSMGNGSTFKMAPLLANGTRVTADPTQLGEYRTLIKINGANTMADTDGSGKVTAANGMRTYTVDGTGPGTATEPMRWVIFVGKNKHVTYEWYSSTGRTGNLDPTLVGDLPSDSYIGVLRQYDPTTGLVTVSWWSAGSGGTRHVGYGSDTGTGTYTAYKNGYFDIIVSENALAVGVEKVVESSTNGIRIESALIADSGTCGITSEITGDWLTSASTIGGGGGCDMVINTGIFSAPPQCFCTPISPRMCGIVVDSATAFDTLYHNASGNLSNIAAYVMCIGPM